MGRAVERRAVARELGEEDRRPLDRLHAALPIYLVGDVPPDRQIITKFCRLIAVSRGQGAYVLPQQTQILTGQGMPRKMLFLPKSEVPDLGFR